MKAPTLSVLSDMSVWLYWFFVRVPSEWCQNSLKWTTVNKQPLKLQIFVSCHRGITSDANRVARRTSFLLRLRDSACSVGDASINLVCVCTKFSALCKKCEREYHMYMYKIVLEHVHNTKVYNKTTARQLVVLYLKISVIRRNASIPPVVKWS